MNNYKDPIIFAKLRCPSCNKKVTYSNINFYPNDGIVIHINSSNKECNKIFPIINEIIILADYKFWPVEKFSSYLIRNKEKLPKNYLDYFNNILKQLKKKEYVFDNKNNKNKYEFVKLQQKIHDSNYKSERYLNCNLATGYISKKIKGSRINRFVDEYTKIKHCEKQNFNSNEWILTICSGDGTDILILNNFLKKKGIRFNNVLTDISFYALLEAKKKFRNFSTYFVLSNSQNPPFYDNSFDISYVHDGLHHLPDPPIALVNLCKKTSRLLLVAEAQRNRILKFLKLQKYESGNVEYRFTKKEIINLIGPYFKKIKIHTAFIQSISSLQKKFNKIDYLIVYVIFRIIFIVFNLIFGKLGNSMLISAKR